MKNFSLTRILTLCLCCFCLMFIAPTTAHAATDYLTTRELVDFVADKVGLETDPEVLYKASYLTKGEYDQFAEHIANGLDRPPIMPTVLSIILPLYQIYPYPVELYPEYANRFSTAGSSSRYQQAFIAGVICGIIPTDFNYYTSVTQDQFDSLIYYLETGAYSLPTPPYRYSPIFNPDDFTWTHTNYMSRNRTMTACPELPESWVQDFINRKWTLNPNPSPILTLTDKDDNCTIYDTSNISGLTHYAGRTIYITNKANSSTVFHEFTHFIIYYAKEDAKIAESTLKYCYNTESQKFSQFLATYSNELSQHAQMNYSEYFACFTAHWLGYPTDRATLTELAPHTSSIVWALINDYDSVKSSKIVFTISSHPVNLADPFTVERFY